MIRKHWTHDIYVPVLQKKILNKIVAASFALVPKARNTLHHEAETFAAKEAFFIQEPWCMKTIDASRSRRSRTKMNLGILLL